MALLIRNGLLLTLEAEDRPYRYGDIRIEDDRIVQIDAQIEPAPDDEVIDACDQLVMPGFNVAHAHSFAQLFKGVFDGLPLDIWILDTNAFPLGWTASPRQLYLRTMLGAADLIRNGATTIWDDLILTPDLQDVFFNAYGESGLRAVITATMYDKGMPDRTLYLREILPPELIEPLATETLLPPDEWIRLSEQIIRNWHGKEGRLSFAVSLAWPQGCTDPLLLKGADLAERYDLPLVTHVLETKIQQVTGKVLYGSTIVQHLHELGILSPRSAIVHGIWTTDRDIELLGRHQASVLHNPSSNQILGSGIMPMRKLLRAGVNIALGVDEGIQTKWNPFEIMKGAALMQRVSGLEPEEWPTSREILAMATTGGSRSELMQREVGSLAVGMKADIILLDLRASAFTPLNDLLNQLVTIETGSSVTTSIINGKVVMRDRKITTFDVDLLLAEAREMMPAYWEFHEKRKTLEFPRKVRPYIEKIYRQVAQTPTGLNRWIGDESAWIGEASREDAV